VRRQKQAADDSDDLDESADGVVDFDDVLEKSRTKMSKAVDWAKAQAYDGVERGRGRVSPAILDSIRVRTPEAGEVPLNQLAAVTVKGPALFVDVWDPPLAKHIEAAIHSANLPGISPLKVDLSTLKVPISMPTHEQRIQILKSIATTVETAKTRVRAARTEALKSIGGRGIEGTKDIQTLASEFGGTLDELLSTARKEFEKV